MRPHAAGTGGGAVGRRKAGAAAAAANREWMVVPASGPARVEEAGKHAVMARTGLPARGLRVLDPVLSYPSTILGRERAIVVNLERVKAVITTAEGLLPNSKDPAFARFVHDLQARVLASSSYEVLFSRSGTCSLPLSLETMLRFRIRKIVVNVCELNCTLLQSWVRSLSVVLVNYFSAFENFAW
jgi:hypothetical protein